MLQTWLQATAVYARTTAVSTRVTKVRANLVIVANLALANIFILCSDPADGLERRASQLPTICDEN